MYFLHSAHPYFAVFAFSSCCQSCYVCLEKCMATWRRKTTQNQPKQNPTKNPQTVASSNNLKCIGSKILEPVSAFCVRTWTLARLTSLPEACSQLFSQRDPQGRSLKASSSFYTFHVSSKLSLLSLITPGSMRSALLSFHPSKLGCAGRLFYLWNPWKQCRLFHRNM